MYWLPPYCPSLNLIERLWGHLKRTVLANVLYATIADLVTAFRKGARRVTSNREHLTFMFTHEEDEPDTSPPVYQPRADSAEGRRPSTGPEKRSALRAGQRLDGAVASRWRPPARSLRDRNRL